MGLKAALLVMALLAAGSGCTTPDPTDPGDATPSPATSQTGAQAATWQEAHEMAVRFQVAGGGIQETEGCSVLRFSASGSVGMGIAFEVKSGVGEAYVRIEGPQGVNETEPIGVGPAVEAWFGTLEEGNWTLEVLPTTAADLRVHLRTWWRGEGEAERDGLLRSIECT